MYEPADREQFLGVYLTNNSYRKKRKKAKLSRNKKGERSCSSGGFLWDKGELLRDGLLEQQKPAGPREHLCKREGMAEQVRLLWLA